jgi:hypothetical protein
MQLLAGILGIENAFDLLSVLRRPITATPTPLMEFKRLYGGHRQYILAYASLGIRRSSRFGGPRGGDDN